MRSKTNQPTNQKIQTTGFLTWYLKSPRAAYDKLMARPSMDHNIGSHDQQLLQEGILSGWGVPVGYATAAATLDTLTHCAGPRIKPKPLHRLEPLQSDS